MIMRLWDAEIGDFVIYGVCVLLLFHSGQSFTLEFGSVFNSVNSDPDLLVRSYGLPK